MANAAGATAIQTEVNRRGLAELRAYHSAVTRHCSQAHPREAEGEGGGVDWLEARARALDCAEQAGALLEDLAGLIELEAEAKGKLVDLLLVACVAARLLGAARTTSCKSAKDRSSMFQTLEVARLAERAGLLDRYARRGSEAPTPERGRGRAFLK